MPGFLVSSIGGKLPRDEFASDCVFEEVEFDGYYCARNTRMTFIDDKAFSLSSAYFVVFEGVLLNKKALFQKYEVTDVVSLVRLMYRKVGSDFFKEFRGSFSGALFDRSTKKWVIFTSQYGDNVVFYHHSPKGFAIGTRASYVLRCMEDGEIGLSCDDSAVYMMLTYAFMIDDSTYVNEVKRLLPGRYMVISSNRHEIVEYYRPKHNSLDLSLHSKLAIIEELDSRFIKVVEQEFEKDVEYGYRHLCELSGGLDSRMVNWVAHELGYTDVVNITFSQSGYLDEVIAEQISAELGNMMLFRPLDDATFLYDAERIVQMNDGLSYYAGLTGGESILRAMNQRQFGLLHTGQLGDVVVGSYLQKPPPNHQVIHAGMYSDKLLSRLREAPPGNYKDQEAFMLETRGFLGMLSSHPVRRSYFEVSSAFLDVDFLELCMSIPIEMRANHGIYRDWILSMHQGAAQFLWERSGARIDASLLQRSWVKCKRKIADVANRLRYGEVFSMVGMTPMDRWLMQHHQLTDWMRRSFSAHIEATESNPELNRDLRFLFEVGNAVEKAQVLTALLAMCYWMNYGKGISCP